MKTKVAVIGGGISGLSFAHYCSTNDFKVIVFEKDIQLGGCIKSVPLSENYYAELGGHTLTYKYATVIDILKSYAHQDKVLPKPSLSFELVEEHERVSILKKLNFFDLFKSLPNMAHIHKKGISVSSYYSKILGSKNYKNLLHYAFQAILCQNPDQFPAEMLFRKRYPNKAYPKNFTFPGGISFLLEMIQSNPNIEIRRQVEIARILKNGPLFELYNGSQEKTEAKYLNLSCPPNIASELLKEIEPEISDILLTIKTNTVETMLVSTDDKDALVNKKKSLIGLDQPFYSALFHEIGGVKYWVFHFEGGLLNREEKKQTIAETIKVAPDQIRIVEEKKSVLPAVSVNNLEKIEVLKNLIRHKPIFFSTNYIEGLAIEDCCVRARNEAGRLLQME